MKIKISTFCIALIMIHCNALAAEINTNILKSQVVYIDKSDDWLKLKSGEVIKGELDGTIKKDSNSYSQEIAFDSDDLGDLDIELKDILVLETARLFTIRTLNGETYVGYLSIRDNKLYLRNGSNEKLFPVTEVVSIYLGTEKDSEHWDAKVTFGLDINSGNSDEYSFRGDVKSERNTVDSRIKLNASHISSEYNDEKTANNTKVGGSYDLYINNRMFFRPLDLFVQSDEFQNLDYQINAAIQLGYFFVANSEMEWDMSLGPGYQYSRYSTVEAGESLSASSSTFNLESNLKHEVTRDIDFIHLYKLNWASEKAGGIRQANEFGFDIDLLGDFELSLDAIWEHVSNPKVNADNVLPEKDDYKLYVGLTYEL
ncbi:YdiY family protein [Vibrio sp. 10N.286.46.E10]|uniref:DUF481 domain-containing protein n=1 Tax=unclassified Vibrio TaxID=2614977 RepID=UPI000D35991B|nr:DUF481 domain-containing protein [Vibrio sp. 10N.286.46.E10]PTQ23623.1 DUF481 domain-containing protein [Vibrio sp. 10N.286.46.E10]